MHVHGGGDGARAHGGVCVCARGPGPAHGHVHGSPPFCGHTGGDGAPIRPEHAHGPWRDGCEHGHDRESGCVRGPRHVHECGLRCVHGRVCVRGVWCDHGHGRV